MAQSPVPDPLQEMTGYLKAAQRQLRQAAKLAARHQDWLDVERELLQDLSARLHQALTDIAEGVAGVEAHD